LPRLGYLKQEWRQTVASDAGVFDPGSGSGRNLLATDLTVASLMAASADATAEANRLLALYGTRRDLVEIDVAPGQLGNIDLNAVIELAIDRFGWNGSRQFRVIGMVENYGNTNSAAVVTLTLWG
jgi:hypothetical protein